METKDRIATKAHELFLRYGIRSISMDEIAAHLGISKKTIYQFYEDKDSLVEAVIDIEIQMNMKDCSLCLEQSDNAIHEVFLAVDMVQEMLKGMNPSIIFDLEKYHPKAFRKMNEHKNDFFSRITKENIERGMREGLYRSDINADIMSRFRVGTMFMILAPDMLLSKYNPAVILREMTENFLFGMATTKGTELIQQYKQQRLKATQ